MVRVGIKRYFAVFRGPFPFSPAFQKLIVCAVGLKIVKFSVRVGCYPLSAVGDITRNICRNSIMAFSRNITRFAPARKIKAVFFYIAAVGQRRFGNIFFRWSIAPCPYSAVSIKPYTVFGVIGSQRVNINRVSRVRHRNEKRQPLQILCIRRAAYIRPRNCDNMPVCGNIHRL